MFPSMGNLDLPSEEVIKARLAQIISTTFFRIIFDQGRFPGISSLPSAGNPDILLAADLSHVGNHTATV